MTVANNADRDWQEWGRKNPYFGVCSDPKFLNANLNGDVLDEFFASGESHVEHVYSVIRAAIRPEFKPDRVLDYGCGVGRLVVPLAHRSSEVIGVDISPEMLELARANCTRLHATSARLLHVSELDTVAPGTMDLVHSFIVFQHIPVARGELMFRRLIALIAEGGVGAIHLTYADSRPPFRRGVAALRRRVNLVHGLINLAQGQSYSAPLMQMNMYSLSRVFNILIDEHCSNLHVEFSEHRAYRGAMLYFEKSGRRLL